MTFYNEAQNVRTYTRFALLLIGMGMLLSIDSFIGYPVIYKFWPTILALMSVGFLGIFIKRNKREPVFLGLSMYLMGFTALALYCNFTSWSIVKHLWPLFITFLGISFVSTFNFAAKKYGLLLLGLLLISLSVVFFLIFALGGQYWWSVFILIGGSILIAERVR